MQPSEREHGEAPERHARNARGKRDEGADDREHPREEDGGVAVLLEPAVRPLDVGLLDAASCGRASRGCPRVRRGRSSRQSKNPRGSPPNPTAVAANRLYSPFDTLNPAKSIVASLGTGMQALSSSMRMKTPGRPIASTTSTATCTIGSVMEAIMGRSRVASLDPPICQQSRALSRPPERGARPCCAERALHPRPGGRGLRGGVRALPRRAALRGRGQRH